MDGEEQFWVRIWTTVITGLVLVAIGGFVTGILSNNNDHDFDRTCISSGKQLTYITIGGDQYSHKVCISK